MAMLNNQMDSDGFRWIQMIGPQPPPTHIARRGHKIINWIDPTDKVVFWAPRTEALERKHWTRGWKSMRLTAVHWAVHWDYRVHCKNLQALQMAMPSAWAMLFIWDQLPSEWFQTSCGRGQKHWCLYTYMHACMHTCLNKWRARTLTQHPLRIFKVLLKLCNFQYDMRWLILLSRCRVVPPKAYGALPPEAEYCWVQPGL